ncbi:MAG TPA: DNA replication/repair protein RecF [Dehalococcoidia bacterium]|nr:DNA replication/repair protein RecF [Dehalococcoidia bacterium]
MHLRHLQLTHFRNYERQDLALRPGPVLLLGANAQGKTNVLEAAFVLATGKSPRTSVDADLIAWGVRDDPQPFARVAGTAVRSDGEVTVEVTVAGRPGANGLVASKRFRLNGVAKRASDVAGAITAVFFTTDDMELVKGSPGERRRYLDVMLGQADRAYGRALSRYGKVLAQRNALLKRLQEGAGKPDELRYWDDELGDEAGVILRARAQAALELARDAAGAHTRLSAGREQFALAYEPRFVAGWTAERIASAEPTELAAALVDRLEQTRARDIAAGMTLVGPHRDDLAMTLGGAPVASYASRGQQRTAALALRLAEAQLLRDRSGERPILLLDDVLSELDEERRESVLGAIDADQALITSADADRFGAGFVAGAQAFEVRGGVATPRG